MNNEERNERKNNSQGIFYAVIGVATLVVTIVGATFAYFSATATSNDNAVSAGSTQMSLTFTEANPNGLKSNLIPMDAALWTSSGDGTIGTWVGINTQGGHNCVDAKGNSICSVYEFTITNPTAANQTIYPTFTSGTNEFVKLQYAVFKGNADDVALSSGNLTTATASAVSSDYSSASGTVVADGTLIVGPTDAPGDSGQNTTHTTQLNNMRITLGPDGSANASITYTIVIWLQESQANQSDTSVTQGTTGTGGNTNEAGKHFTGTISFTTSSGVGGVTGQLSA